MRRRRIRASSSPSYPWRYYTVRRPHASSRRECREDDDDDDDGRPADEKCDFNGCCSVGLFDRVGLGLIISIHRRKPTLSVHAWSRWRSRDVMAAKRPRSFRRSATKLCSLINRRDVQYYKPLYITAYSARCALKNIWRKNLCNFSTNIAHFRQNFVRQP